MKESKMKGFTYFCIFFFKNKCCTFYEFCALFYRNPVNPHCSGDSQAIRLYPFEGATVISNGTIPPPHYAGTPTHLSPDYLYKGR